MFLKGVLVYFTLATIVCFIVALKAIIFSNWFLPVILLIIIECTLINKYVYWEELKKILLLY